jgi:hypothetical protein
MSDYMSDYRASYREIAAIQKDAARARALAQGLARLDDMAWTDWELDFLHSMAARQQELTTRQGEKLIELCDDAVWYTAVDGFSLKALVDRCHLLRDELADRDAQFIERLKAQGAARLRRKDARRLLACARTVGEIEPHHGRSLDRLPDVSLEADEE